MRVLLIGERANSALDPTLDCLSVKGWAAKAQFMGAFSDRRSRTKLVSIGVDVSECASMNLLLPAPAGAEWDARRAADVAVLVASRLDRYALTLLAGLKVARAFGVDGRLADLAGRRVEVGGGDALVIPHPSGLNHWWNDPKNVEELRRCLRRFAS